MAEMTAGRIVNKRIKSKRPNRPKSAPGPKPDVLKLKGKWQDAVKQSLKKKTPPEGWPK
jgi:hypothetical protein